MGKLMPDVIVGEETTIVPPLNTQEPVNTPVTTPSGGSGVISGAGGEGTIGGEGTVGGEGESPRVVFGIPSVIPVGVVTDFTIGFVPGDQGGTMVKGVGEFPSSGLTVWYYETADGTWKELKGSDFGPSTGFPLMAVTSKFRVRFDSPYEGDLTVKIVKVEDSSVLATSSVTVKATSNGPMTLEDGGVCGGGFNTYSRLIITADTYAYKAGGIPISDRFDPIMLFAVSAKGGITGWIDRANRKVVLYKGTKEVSGNLEGLSVVLLGH